MLRESFNDMNHLEKQVFVCELTHAIQNDDTLFSYAVMIVGMARRNGLFSKIKILPSNEVNDIF